MPSDPVSSGKTCQVNYHTQQTQKETGWNSKFQWVHLNGTALDVDVQVGTGGCTHPTPKWVCSWILLHHKLFSHTHTWRSFKVVFSLLTHLAGLTWINVICEQLVQGAMSHNSKAWSNKWWNQAAFLALLATQAQCCCTAGTERQSLLLSSL